MLTPASLQIGPRLFSSSPAVDKDVRGVFPGLRRERILVFCWVFSELQPVEEAGARPSPEVCLPRLQEGALPLRLEKNEEVKVQEM